MVSTPYDPWVKIEGIPAVSGPTSINATLLDTVVTPNYEGIWVPWQFVKQGSLEISGTFATLSCQLIGTNSQNPFNSYVITFGGSATNGDVVTVNFATAVATLVATIPIVTSEATPTMATALAAFINTSAIFATYGFQAVAIASAVTVTWPSFYPISIGAFSTSSPPPAPAVLITSSVSGGATETVTVTAGTGGSSMGSAITALGMTQFSLSARWIKIRVTTLTGGNVTAIAQGTA
jgi:hypothetical protein